MSESLTHSIPRSFLVVAVSASAVGFANALWLCPERALRLFFASVSLVDPVALSPLLRRVYADGFRHWSAFRLVSSEPLGSCGGSTCIALHRTWLVSANLPCAIGAQVGVAYFTARRSARIHGDHFISFTDSCVSLNRHSHRVMFLGHLQDEWLGWLPVPLLALPGLCHLRWLIVKTVWSDPNASCDRHSVAVSLSPSLTVAMTPCYCGTLGGLYVLVGSLTYPSPGRMFELSCYGRLQCQEAGLTYSPLLALPGLCLMPDL